MEKVARDLTLPVISAAELRGPSRRVAGAGRALHRSSHERENDPPRGKRRP